MTIETPTTVPRSPESILEGLTDYCKDHSIDISPLVTARRYPGRGLGIYASGEIKKGEKLVHVPTKALFTTQSVPRTFLSKAARKDFTVHCLLAAYLAFGKEEDLTKHQRWIDTWPTLEDFTESMPIFWLRNLCGIESAPPSASGKNLEPDRHINKRRKTSNHADGRTTSGTATIPTSTPGLDKTTPWLSLSNLSRPHTLSNPLFSQVSKIRSCLSTIAQHFPHLDLSFPTSPYLVRFLHAWSSVNTRCFYYLRPGQSPPLDSNEAIALCPFQDLFNHTDSNHPNCHIHFDKSGSHVTADRDYAAGEELFLTYGRHSNDALWVEYGFTLDENGDDHVKIGDGVVLDALVPARDDAAARQKRQKMLDDAGYLGDYTLESSGVCYRTVVASYLGVLTDAQWQRMVSGAGRPDPETDPAYRPQKLAAKRRIVRWILCTRAAAEDGLRALRRVTRESEGDGEGGEGEALVKMWVSGTMTTATGAGERQRLARTRMRTCAARWSQVFDLCMQALRALERDCPGCCVQLAEDDDGDEGRESVGDLSMTTARFLAGLDWEQGGGV